MTPAVLPLSSQPTNAFLAFSTPVYTSGSSAWSRHHLMPPSTSRLASRNMHTMSSFTALLLAPGVLKTTTPSCAKRSTGMLLKPAPARATALMPRGSCMSCMLELRMMMPSAFSMSGSRA